jgi:fructokinase
MDDLDPALAGEPGVLVVGSDTLLGSAERAVTMRAAELAAERGWRILCDPNVRPRRWPDEDEMLRVIRGLVSASSVVKLNEAEVRVLGGEEDAARAGAALLGLGLEAVVITLGARGALVVTAGGATPVAPRPADVVDTTGAGDCVAGVLAAGLAAGVSPEGLPAVVEVAMAASAGVIAAWGATEGLPPATEAREALRAALAGH